MASTRVWLARGAGVALALALARGWLARALPLLGALALARVLASACALWLAPALPRRRLPALARRAVLVTGCDSGFGHAAALRLHALGARVFACVLLPHGPGAERLRHLACPRMRVLPLDVTDPAAVAAARDAVEKDLEHSACELQAIVNNAGVLYIGETEWMDIEEVKTSLDVNVLGQVRVAQTFLPLLKKSKGRVVNVNSLAGRIPFAGLVPYVLSKYASVAFTECLKVDMLRFSVSVHSIEPAIYMTPMATEGKSLVRNKLEAISKKNPNMFGHRYSEKFMKLVELAFLFFSKPLSKISEVADVIEDACLSEDPLDCYYPGEHSKFAIAMKEIYNTYQAHIVTLIHKFW